MKLNHIDLQVSDIGRARTFFKTFFDFRCTYQRERQIAILEDDGGLSLGLSNLFNSAPPVYPPVSTSVLCWKRQMTSTPCMSV